MSRKPKHKTYVFWNGLINVLLEDAEAPDDMPLVSTIKVDVHERPVTVVAMRRLMKLKVGNAIQVTVVVGNGGNAIRSCRCRGRLAAAMGASHKGEERCMRHD